MAVNFFFKIVRNSVILAALFFLNIWMVSELSPVMIKATVGFLLTYVLTELGNHYGVRNPSSKHSLCF